MIQTCLYLSKINRQTCLLRGIDEVRRVGHWDGGSDDDCEAGRVGSRGVVGMGTKQDPMLEMEVVG
jgi:hypothetical protein